MMENTYKKCVDRREHLNDTMARIKDN